MTRRQRARAGWVGLAAAVVVLGLGIWQQLSTRADLPAVCRVLDAHPYGLTSFDWDNGYTGTEATWLTVLTDGVDQAAPDEQQALADAVASDDEGYQRLLDGVPAEARPAARRLHALVLDPAPAATRRSDPAVQADIGTLAITRRECPGI